MRRSSRFNDVERAVSTAMYDPSIQEKGGFVVVQWQEWFYVHATGEPDASLETIMGTTTSGVIVQRYRFIDGRWQHIYDGAHGNE